MVGGMVGQVAAGANIVATGSKVANAIIENTDAASRQGLAGGMVGYIASGATAEQVFTSCEVYNTVVKARMSDALAHQRQTHRRHPGRCRYRCRAHQQHRRHGQLPGP